MFIPLTIRHGYDRRPVAIWTLAILLTVVNLFFLAVPGWISQTNYGDVLRLTQFDRDALHGVNYFSYAFFYPNVWLFLFDIALLILFGSAVEARLGGGKTLIILLGAIPLSIFVHGAVDPQSDVAGMTAGVFALIGAAALIYGFSETDGIALFPLPPTYKVGFTYTWTIYFILFFIIAGFAWARLAPEGVVSIIGYQGLGMALIWGMLACALLIGGRIPILNPSELDPSTIRRIQDQNRRMEVQKQLEEDGLLTQVGDIPLPGEPRPQAGDGSSAAVPETSRLADIELRKQSLIKMVSLRNAAELADTYQRFVEDFPSACLASGAQLDLALELEKGYSTELALHAFERLIQCHPHTSAAQKALLHAALLLHQIGGRDADGLRYAERFLMTDPPRHELLEAQQLEHLFRARILESKVHPAPLVPAEVVQPAQSSSTPEPNLELPPEAEVEEPPAVVDSENIERVPLYNLENFEEIVIRPSQIMADVFVHPHHSNPGAAGTVEIEAPSPARAIQQGRPRSSTSGSPHLYTLMVVPKTEIRLDVLTEVFGEFWGVSAQAAQDRLRRRKGLIHQNLPLDVARQLMDKCAQRNQRLLMAPETPDLHYPGAMEADSLLFRESLLVWQGGGSTVQASPEQVRMLSAGLVRIQPNSDRAHSVMDIYLREPHLIVRLWEHTLRTVDDESLKDVPPRQALEALSKKLWQLCAHAHVTHAFERLFGAEAGDRPLVFDRVEEFSDYNQWNLLAADYWQKIP